MTAPRDPTLDTTIAAAATIGLGVVAIAWAGAAVAATIAGQPLDASFDDAIAATLHLPGTAASPADAWPTRPAIPPALYWAATLAVAAAVAGPAALAWRHLPRSRVGSIRRRPLGVDGRARFARRRDLAPLAVDTNPGDRFSLGRHHRRQLATENGATRGARRGDRGAVAFVGPSRSGKTTAVITGILDWRGPAVLSSVKADLLAATIDHRTRIGEVRTYDPTGSTGRPGNARWSPTARALTTLGAQRAARALCDAAPKAGVDGGLDFWLAQAEILLAGLLHIAARSARDMGHVARWILTQDRPTSRGIGEIGAALAFYANTATSPGPDPAADAERAIRAIWALDDRTRASVYATAQTLVWPWSDPAIAASSRGDSVDLDWLLQGANTLYLTAPIEDQRRLSPAFGGLLNDLVNQVYAYVAATGTPLDPPLLIVIDEAGNTPLRALPEFASTLSGLGVQLITVWQSLAQVQASYPKAADTLLTNHLTKLFFAGINDPATLRYLTTVLGDTEIETRHHSRDATGTRGSVQHASTRTALVPPHALRQMRPREALLLHGTLPPAHVKTVPYYERGNRKK